MADTKANGNTLSGHGPNDTGILKVQARESSTMTKLSEPLDDTNWTAWRERMKRVLRLCGVEDYAEGKVGRPENTMDAANWDYNDNYAQVIIVNNISSTDMVHLGQCDTANAMWSSLKANESKDHQTIIAVFRKIRNLFHTASEDNTNISEHLNKLTQYLGRINLMGDEDFKISDDLFKFIVASSLPLSWDVFTDAYVGGRKGVIETDQKKLLSPQQFIGILKEEYLRREARTQRLENVNQAIPYKRSLANRMDASPSANLSMYCKHCGRRNHNTQNCLHLGKNKCGECGNFGHAADYCWSKGKPKRKKEST